MSRPPRVEVANGVYHVVSRGNERELVLRQIAGHLGCGVTTVHRRVRVYEAAVRVG